MPLLPSAVSRIGCLVLVAGLMVVGVPSQAWPDLVATAQPLTELRVKAAFLFNLAKFVTWPATDQPLAICVAGNAALTAAATEIVKGRVIEGRQVVARALAASGSADGCDLLYLGDLKADDASAILSGVRGPVLTVGETPRFLRDGGTVRVFLEDNRMRFQVNRRQAEAAGLKISSQLLALATQ